MPRRSVLKPAISLEKLLSGLPTSDYSIDVTVVYHDTNSRKWAAGIYQRVESLLGSKSVRGTWWNLADFRQPAVLAGAVSKAIRADMIIIAVQSSEGLPLPFYFWVNAWLPNRRNGSGALVALLGQPVPKTTQSGRLKKFLDVVARRARMDLLVTERLSVALEQPEPGIQSRS
jgi:hypothetical protein